MSFIPRAIIDLCPMLLDIGHLEFLLVLQRCLVLQRMTEQFSDYQGSFALSFLRP